MYRRAQVRGAEGSAVAKRVHSALWELIVDAKNRKRNPDGSLVSTRLPPSLTRPSFAPCVARAHPLLFRKNAQFAAQLAASIIDMAPNWA
jgi:hypothetical protein